MASIVYGGLDVHQKSISVCLLGDTGEVVTDEVANEREQVLRAVRHWTKLGELRLCYEASGAGFVLKRWLDSAGINCEVIAPSLIPRAPGDRVKTDKRDARKLATLYRAQLLRAVRVPDGEEETVRALVRLHDELTRDMTRAKNRVLKFLMTQGHHYAEGGTWTQKHRAWIQALPLGEMPRVIVQTHLDELDSLAERRRGVYQRIEVIAHSERYWGNVQRLMSLRGIALHAAMVVLTEVGDASRFPDAPHIMSYFGLVPSEDWSANNGHSGPITKAGNSRVRWILAEAAWCQMSRPGNCQRLKKHWESQPKEVVAIAKKAERRLHDKFWKVATRRDRRTAVTAVAREMAGFIWALLTLEVAAAGR